MSQGPNFNVVLDGGFREHPVKTVVLTGLLTLLDVGVNIGLSAVLEAVFPAYSPSKNVWLGGLEAAGEMSLHVLLSSLVLYWGRSVFSTRGTLVPYGALVGVFLMAQALRKMYALQAHVLNNAYTRLGKKAVGKTDDDSEGVDPTRHDDPASSTGIHSG